jgi:hypothetical protein
MRGASTYHSYMAVPARVMKAATTIIGIPSTNR